MLAAILLWPCHAQGRDAPVLDQEPITIQGNRALPGTLYIQPWKRVGTPLDSGALSGGTEADMDPLEREGFRRELELRRKGYRFE